MTEPTLAELGAMGHFGSDDYQTCANPKHWESIPREEYPDETARENGPIVVGQRCPWCGGMVDDEDHTRSHD